LEVETDKTSKLSSRASSVVIPSVERGIFDAHTLKANSAQPAQGCHPSASSEGSSISVRSAISRRTLGIILFIFLLTVPLHAGFRAFEALPVDPELESELARIAGKLLTDFAGSSLTSENLAITLIDLSSNPPKRASYHGRIPFHPASVVKLFYFVYAYDLIHRNQLTLDTALQQGFTDMIVDSGNDATSYVVDRITGTTSGPELWGEAFKAFVDARNGPNRYYKALGYDISANGKTWCEGLYGREKQIFGPNRENRNRATSDVFAALMLSLATRNAVSPASDEAMLRLLKRPIPGQTGTDGGQVKDLTGESLPPGSKLWSKAGWTSEVRHDLAYVELQSGRKYVLAAMTRGASEDKTILPALSKEIVALMSR